MFSGSPKTTQQQLLSRYLGVNDSVVQACEGLRGEQFTTVWQILETSFAASTPRNTPPTQHVFTAIFLLPNAQTHTQLTAVGTKPAESYSRYQFTVRISLDLQQWHSCGVRSSMGWPMLIVHGRTPGPRPKWWQRRERGSSWVSNHL